MNIVTYIVPQSDNNKHKIGKAFEGPPFNKFDKNTDGFCNTITLDAANRVDNVIQMTNLAGRNINVGSPMKIANNANTTEPINKYIACVTLVLNATLNGPASGILPDNSDN